MKQESNYYIKGDFITRSHFQQTLLKNNLTRYTAYFLYSLFAKILIFIKKLTSSPKRQYKYNVCVCALFKNEGKFLEEWIEYHLVVGVDCFYLYNNNSDDHYLDILDPYIKRGIVVLVDWPHDHAQMSAYKDCYTKFRDDTNWLLFIDLDEFVCPLNSDTINSWLAPMKKYPGIAIYWKQFGSNGKLIHDPNQLVIEQYTQCWEKPSVYTKMICNMDFPIYEFDNPHVICSTIFGFKIPPINQFKKLVSFGINRGTNVNNPSIQINHYWGKAFDCFMESKVKRSDVYHKNDKEMGQLRLMLLDSHEAMCSVKEHKIHRFLLRTKLQINKEI